MNDLILKKKMQLTVSDITDQSLQNSRDAKLFYILEGTMQLYAGGRQFDLGSEDLFIINTNVNYSYTAANEILYVDVPILFYLVGDICNGTTSRFLCDSTTIADCNIVELRRIVNKLLYHSSYMESESKNFEYTAFYYEFLHFITKNFVVQAHTIQGTEIESKDEQRRSEIDAYICTYYEQQITLEDVANKLFLSKNYLSRYFSKIYGMSFSKYLMQVRLTNTIDELIYTDKPIIRIALDNGFESISFFNKCFKEKFGKTPTEFKNSISYKKEKEVFSNQSDVEKISRKLENHQNKRQKEEQEYLHGGKTYSVRENYPLKPVWNRLINIGEARNVLDGGIQEHILILKKSFQFQYIRFWNLLSEDLLVIGKENFNFKKIDRIFDYILSTGLKPFIDLEQKLNRINKTITEYVLLKKFNILFESREEWKNAISSLLIHLEKRYGKEELSNWILEVGQYRFYKSDLSDECYFFEMFSDVYRIVKKRVPDMKVGGSCESEFFRVGGLDHFFFLWSQEECQPDFVTQMGYAYERESLSPQYTRSSADIHILKSQIEKNRKLMEYAGMADIPIYVTEWNLTISDRNSINDSCFKACYLMQSYLDLYGETEVLGYFLGSDRSSEYLDSDELLHGGCGLLTVDGIYKPSAFVFEFFRDLFPYYIARENNYLITTNQRDQYRMVCHNMKSLNNTYYRTKEEKIDYENIKIYYENLDKKQLNITLKNVTNGKYQVKISRINPENGSVISVWKELGYSKELSREDVKYLRNTCRPRMSMGDQEVTRNELILSVEMMFNEIAYVSAELIKKL